MADQTKKQPMKGKPEVDATGVHPKSQRGNKQAKAGQLQHTNPHIKRGRNWLRLFVSGVLVTSAVGAEATIYAAGFDSTTMINTMWIVGVTYAAALVVVNFCKLE